MAHLNSLNFWILFEAGLLGGRPHYHNVMCRNRSFAHYNWLPGSLMHTRPGRTSIRHWSFVPKLWRIYKQNNLKTILIHAYHLKLLTTNWFVSI